jgi:pyruvate kinase
MRRPGNTKIVATLGPASNDLKTIRALVKAGADVFRCNFSHGSYEDHRQRYELVREVERQTGRPIGILMDLQGPKLRVGHFAGGPVHLQAGSSFRLDLSEQAGDASRVQLPHPEIFAAIKPGTELLLDDGRIRLRVQHGSADFAATQVLVGGELSDHKGVNVPGVILPLSPITAKDREDLAYGLELGVDWVGLSFVQRPEDIDELRALVGTRAAILAKLEKPAAAVNHLEAIVKRVDAIMVARGDLGVEVPPEQVPVLQKRIIQTCRRAGKPVIVATQMLESMIESPVPTRAEASDVAAAVYDGADAVMLSGETAAGKYPVEAVTIMNRIILQVEKDPYYRKLLDAHQPVPEPTTEDAICAALRTVTSTLPIAAIVAYTTSGYTSLRAARERPEAPILSLTPRLEVARRLALVWGVHAVHTTMAENITEIVNRTGAIAVQEGFALPGQPIVITGGMPFGQSGTTNLLRIAWIRDVQFF